MVKELVVPEIAENIVSVHVLRILVSEGDSISKNDSIVEVETDKAVTEIPASFGGKVTEILVSKDDTIDVGQTIMTVEVGEADGAGETDESGEAEEPDQTEEAEEADQTEEAEVSAEAGKAEETPKAGDAGEPETSEDHTSSELVPAAPSVRRLARELGIDIQNVTGSGPKGRMSQDDVKGHARQIISGCRQEDTADKGRQRSGKAPEPDAYTGPLPDFTRWGKTERESMNKVRQITAQITWASWQVIPQVTQHDTADISMLESFRTQYGGVVAKQGGKLTVTAMIIKIVAATLQKFPKFNASLDINAQEIIYKRYINIGVAADTPRGLLVPVVRDADKKDLTQIALELGTLADKARNKKISLDEMQGGTFTVSNVGGIGGSFFTPIILWPQVAILGIGKARMEPVYTDDGFIAKPVMPLSLTYDHRIIDGAEGARFLSHIAESLKNPFLLFMDAK